MVSAAATNRVSASLPCVGALKNARRIVASGRLCPRSPEQRQHLLAYRGEVVDPDGAAPRRLVPGDRVVAIGLHLQPPAARPVSLRAVGDRQLAGRQAGRGIEDIEQRLPLGLPARRGRLFENRKRDPLPEGKFAPADGLNALAAFVGGSGHSLPLWNACRSRASSWWEMRSCAASPSTPTPTGSAADSFVAAFRFDSSRPSATSMPISCRRFASTSSVPS